MATLSIDIPNGDRSTTLADAAAEAGYPRSAAGVKAMVMDYIREKYRAQKALEAQRAVAATIDTAVSNARSDAQSIV